MLLFLLLFFNGEITVRLIQVKIVSVAAAPSAASICFSIHVFKMLYIFLYFYCLRVETVQVNVPIKREELDDDLMLV